VKIAQPLFPNDDGLADPALIRALGEGDPYAIVAALGKTRVFVALLAELDSASSTEAGLKVEQESHMALTWLTLDKQKALPIFTSLNALANWNLMARPLGVEVERVAIVAASEGGVLLLDPGSPTSYELGIGPLRSLALGYEFLPLDQDQEITAAVTQAVTSSFQEGNLMEFDLQTQNQGAQSDLIITLYSPKILPSEGELSRFATLLAKDERILLRLTGELEVRLAVR